METEVLKRKAMSDIYMEIKEQGFKGSRTPFYDYYRTVIEDIAPEAINQRKQKGL